MCALSKCHVHRGDKRGLKLNQPEADNNVKDGQRRSQYTIRPEDSLADKALKGVSRCSLGDLDPSKLQ